MKKIIQNETLGEIVYNESFWTGKKSLTVNGVEAKKVTKKEYSVGEKKVFIKGNFFAGIDICIDNNTIEIEPKPKWYEIVLAVLPLVFLLVWGNSVSLCEIFPVVGGAIGGAVGAVFSVLSLFLMKKVEKPLYKVLIGIGVFAVNVLVGYGIALIILQMIS